MAPRVPVVVAGRRGPRRGPNRRHLLQAERLLQLDAWVTEHAGDVIDAVG